MTFLRVASRSSTKLQKQVVALYQSNDSLRVIGILLGAPKRCSRTNPPESEPMANFLRPTVYEIEV